LSIHHTNRESENSFVMNLMNGSVVCQMHQSIRILPAGVSVKFFVFREIRECLKLDPEHPDCFPLYKKVKKVDKLVNNMETGYEEKDFDKCIEAAKKVSLFNLKQ